MFTSRNSELHASTNSNVYIAKLPVHIDEATLTKLFERYGTIECCRVQRNPQNTTGRTFGFVKFRTSKEAQLAIESMNGALINDAPIEVKVADQDPGEKATGGTPSDNLYVRNLPNEWTSEEMISLFSQFGTVINCRMLHTGEGVRGAGGLVRMGSAEEAAQAISGLNGRIPQGGSHMLFVRYADTSEDKARRKAKKASQIYRYSPYSAPSLAGVQIVQQPLYRLDSGSYGGSTWRGLGHNGTFTIQSVGSYGESGFPAEEQVGFQSQSKSCSIYIKNLPPTADKLFLYERFARFGAITSVNPMPDEITGACKGIGFVNFTDSAAAQLAVDSMDGIYIGDKILHVSIQNAKLG